MWIFHISNNQRSKRPYKTSNQNNWGLIDKDLRVKEKELKLRGEEQNRKELDLKVREEEQKNKELKEKKKKEKFLKEMKEQEEQKKPRLTDLDYQKDYLSDKIGIQKRLEWTEDISC